MIQINQGLPRISKCLMELFSKKYREKYKYALKLQRWPLEDTAKMEKEKKEKARKAKLKRLYGLKDDNKSKT